MNPISHPIEREELMTLLDGELDPERRAALATHLEHCAECRAFVEDLRTVSHRLQAWEQPPAPDTLTEHIRGALDERAPGQCERPTLPAPPKPRFRGGLRWAFGLAGVAAGLLIVAALAIPNLLRSRQAANQAVKKTGAMYSTNTPSDTGVPRPGSSALLPAGPMIVRTAALTLVTKEFESERAAVEHIVLAHRGYIAQLNVSAEIHQGRWLVATLRVPSDQLGAALDELKRLGRVEQESQGGEEVTEQYVDLNARLANARHTEQRLAEVLTQRTGKVADVLEVEREIARVRGEIEQMEARRKNLENQVAFATVQLRLNEEYKAEMDVAPLSAGNRLRNAVVEGYRALFDSALGLLLAFLRYGPSLLFWLVILFWPARLVWRRVRTWTA